MTKNVSNILQHETLSKWFVVDNFHLYTVFCNPKQGAQIFDMSPK